MPIFILMTRLAPENLHDAKVRRALGKEWLQKVRQTCPEVKFLAHYALLGPYDAMDVYEAPDVETAHRVSLIS
ncbi:GYD domain-containing protein, partial [bacterium]|nr:GYD domain-containing protein [bacterium]